MAPLPSGEILFEFRRVGGSVKVTAIHADTGTEVCLIAPAGGGAHALKMAAARKLAYVMAKATAPAKAGRDPGGV
jgi:hypothetical protein